ncbi:MAG: adenylate/guanylate cyclase domain-containing protein [Ignavibacteria bacterium]|nr:adenylate/guanylate cyclase domain-containing protein [Ignavibacteria bacterium]
MNSSVQSKRNRKSVLLFTLFTSAVAVLFALVNRGFMLTPVINHLIFGIIFGLITGSVEIYILEKRLRRMKFSVAVLIRSLLYILVFAVILFAILLVNFNIHDNTAFQENVKRYGNLTNFLESKEFYIMLGVCVIMIFFINFIRQINRLMGQNVLLNYVMGKYQLPLEEDLIFMFLDLKSSTTIAERIGLEKNHEFLNDFFYDMTDPILECKGRIYQYVGDEIVITWHMKDGISYLNCIKCFFEIRKKIRGKKELYIQKYDVFPEFKAGLHCGKVITGEIGDIKKDIVYHGDTVNTAARIQTECNVYNKTLLISNVLLDKLDISGKYKTESMGNIMLRGKVKVLELFSIEENNH